MSLSEILENHTDPLSVEPDTSIAAAAKIMADRRIGFLLILNSDGSLHGVISERDIVRDVAAGNEGFDSRSVSGIATRSVQTCSRNDDPHQVFDRMTKGKFRHMPVAEDGRIQGVVSMSDLLRHFEKASSPDARAKAFQAFFSGDAVPGG